jgi:hypothetical protein
METDRRPTNLLLADLEAIAARAEEPGVASDPRDLIGPSSKPPCGAHGEARVCRRLT